MYTYYFPNKTSVKSYFKVVLEDLGVWVAYCIINAGREIVLMQVLTPVRENSSRICFHWISKKHLFDFSIFRTRVTECRREGAERDINVCFPQSPKAEMDFSTNDTAPDVKTNICTRLELESSLPYICILTSYTSVPVYLASEISPHLLSYTYPISVILLQLQNRYRQWYYTLRTSVYDAILDATAKKRKKELH